MRDVEAGETVLTIGTRKGLFFLHSKDRRSWTLRGPFFEGTSVAHALLDPRDGRTTWVGVTSDHWGPTVQRSKDFGGSWLRDADQPKFPEGSGLAVTRVWHVEPGLDGALYAGVEPAGLFKSVDGGKTWAGVEGLNAHETRGAWIPGGGGLCLHTILPHPHDPRRMIVAASAVGVLETRDGGGSWALRNGGIRAGHLPDGVTEESAPGSCPHKLARDPARPDRLLMQNHFGVYARGPDENAWREIGQGLPGTFGFPLAVHPRTGEAFLVPLVADSNRVTFDGAMAVWRGDGKRWTRLSEGLPQRNAWLTVLREGLAVDTHDPLGVYVGTTGGHLFASRDEGATWTQVAEHLPPILSVEAGVAR